MKIDLDGLELDALRNQRSPLCSRPLDPEVELALVRRIRELETLGTEALNRLATAIVALQAEGVYSHAEANGEVQWVKARHEIIAKGVGT